MVRPFLVEFEDAIYHVMACGNARQKIFLAANIERTISNTER